MTTTQTGTFNNVYYAVRSDCAATALKAIKVMRNTLRAMNISYIEDIHKGSNLNTMRTAMDIANLRGLSWGLGDTEADALEKL
jgi:hypothetical protein